MKVSKFKVNSKSGVKLRNTKTDKVEKIESNAKKDAKNYDLTELLGLAAMEMYRKGEKNEPIVTIKAAITLFDEKGNKISFHDRKKINEDMELEVVYAHTQKQEKAIKEQVEKEERKKRVREQAKKEIEEKTKKDKKKK